MENERNINGQQLPVAHPVECPKGYSPINLIPRALFPDFGGVNRNMPSMSFFGLDRHLGLTPNSNTHNLIDCFNMTSRGHIYTYKTMNRLPCLCTKKIPWELNFLLFQAICKAADHVTENDLLKKLSTLHILHPRRPRDKIKV